jgi:hypothetical protein
MNLLIGPQDISVDLGKGRDPGLPTIFKTNWHPKKTGPGNIYYYIQNQSRSELSKAMELEEKVRIPQGPESLAIEQGELEPKRLYSNIPSFL